MKAIEQKVNAVQKRSCVDMVNICVCVYKYQMKRKGENKVERGCVQVVIHEQIGDLDPEYVNMFTVHTRVRIQRHADATRLEAFMTTAQPMQVQHNLFASALLRLSNNPAHHKVSLRQRKSPSSIHPSFVSPFDSKPNSDYRTLMKPQ